MLPMSVVTMAFLGNAFSSSRNARRGGIGEPSAADSESSSYSQASLRLFTSAMRASRLPGAATGTFCALMSSRIAAAAIALALA